MFVIGQIVNVNPDSTGNIWIGGDAVPLSLSEESNIPIMVLSEVSDSITLDSVADNSQYFFMPPVFDQDSSGSCIHVAEIWYTLGYELNRLRNDTAGYEQDDEYNNHQYHPYYSYNFRNGGNMSSGTSKGSGFSIVKDNGCPSSNTFDDPAIEDFDNDTCYLYWMHGASSYVTGMHNKIDSLVNIKWDSTYASLDLLKHWLHNHNNGDTTGGLAIIQVNTKDMVSHLPLPPGSPEFMKLYVSQWGTSGGHALTLVGYHDEIHSKKLDGDDQYTNWDRDGDGKIELDECEKGAFKAVNSWGPDGFGDAGYIYIPYSLMSIGELQVDTTAYTCITHEFDTPELVVKSSVEFPTRWRTSYEIGYANNANQNIQVDSTKFASFRSQGGAYEMRGAYPGPIETGLDFSNYFKDRDFGKIFFSVNKFPICFDTGTIKMFSIIDYRWNEVFELACSDTGVLIINNKTYMSIDYDLIPHESPITTTDTLFSDMVSRFNPEVSDGATLLVEKGVSIDMYNSEITINEGSTLTLKDSVTITAKRDTCKIVIEGEINIGKHINFIAEDSALLEIWINNNNLISTFDSIYFDRCKIFHYGKELNIKNSEFIDCQRIYSGRGTVTIDKCELTQTGVHIYNIEDADFRSTISNCELNTDNTGTLPGIRVHGCDRFNIFNNTISGYFTGIDLRFCGTDEYTDKKVYDNTIDSCSFNGISTYYSTVLIEGNNIQNNLRGISFFNNSTTEVIGDEGASSYEESQQISNNTSYELYSSLGSFPWSIQYNIIHDSDNVATEDPIVYTEINPAQLIPDTFDIRYNCWDTNFDSITDLSPSFPFFKIKPNACPGKKSTSTQSAEPLYRIGLDQFVDEQYLKAHNTFQQVVDQFPGSSFSLAAMKSMFDVEQFVDNDYNTLQDYYLTNTSIVSDSSMKILGIFLANRCNLSTGQWQAAINHYENIIDNPPTPDDSIFAIIDLGYTYLLMQNTSGKYVAMGKMTEHIPNSDREFEAKSTNLLTLLPFKKSNNLEDNDETIGASVKENRLLQSKPNPTSGITEVSFSLSCQNYVGISILNNMGSKLKTTGLAGKKGVNSIKLNMSDLPSGIYYYTLEIDDRIVDVQKMIVVR